MSVYASSASELRACRFVALCIFFLAPPGELKPAMLVLRDGREFRGYSFGHRSSIGGEVVFNTGTTH